MKEPFREHLQSSRDLETTHAAYRAGFVALALERNHRATPIVQQARALRAAALRASAPKQLVEMEEIQAALLTAAGVSDKAASHFGPEDKRKAIEGLIEGFLLPAQTAFVEELVYRFLLTRGDSLGGSMRNLGGKLAQQRITLSVLAHLRNAGRGYRWLRKGAKQWSNAPRNEAGLERELRALGWESQRGQRVLYYDIKVAVSRSHVDLILLNCDPETVDRKALQSPALFLALGELKGGIDPNGADEHWKTARTAISRIHASFATSQVRPLTFYIGAAIERKMAEEIWDFLQRGIIENAANLTNESQLAAIVRWLCGL